MNKSFQPPRVMEMIANASEHREINNVVQQGDLPEFLPAMAFSRKEIDDSINAAGTEYPDSAAIEK
ncbi:MAG: hypothetical protein AAF353_09000 [Pseudomonadota bacterium]